MAREDTLVMSSSTDTPQEIREGLGLPPLEPVDPVAQAQATLEKATADAAAARAAIEAAEAAEEGAEAGAEVPAPKSPAAGQGEPPAGAPHKSGRQRRIDELTREKNDERAARTVAETEVAALRSRLAELAAQAVTRPAAEPVARPATETVTSPRLTAIATERNALKRPKREDYYNDPDPDGAYETARDEFVAAKSSLDTEERLERRALAADQSRTAGEATRAQQSDLATLARRRIDAARLVHADYDAVVTDDVRLRPMVYAALQDPGYEMAAELAYYLGQHKAELDELNALDMDAEREYEAVKHNPAAPRPALMKAIEAIGAAKANMRATLGSRIPDGRHAGATQTGAATAIPPRARPRTQAPEPQGSTLGAAPGAVSVTELETMPETRVREMSMAEYNEVRNRQTRTRR
jgi:hypothetical protein